MTSLEKKLYEVQLKTVYILNSSQCIDVMIIKRIAAHSKFAAENEAKKMVKDSLNKEAIIVAINCENATEIKPKEPLFVREGFKNEE